MKVLVVTNSQEVMKEISFYIRLAWHDASIVSATQGSKGIELVETEKPDLVVTNCPLPDIHPLDLIPQIREFSDVPVMMLIDQADEANGVRCLEAGADDYVTQPLNGIVFLAKTRALLRRIYGDYSIDNHAPLVSGSLVINPASHEVSIAAEQVTLTPIQYNLLLLLVRNENRVLTHEVLLEKLWGRECTRDTALLKDHIYRLRKGLRQGSQHAQMILTVRGTGYKFMRPT